MENYEYLKKLQKERKWMDLNPIEQLLFCELYYQQWKKNGATFFSCSNKKLMRAINKAESVFLRARNRLIESNFITYTKGVNRHKAGHYSIIRLEGGKDVVNQENNPKSQTAKSSVVDSTTVDLRGHYIYNNTDIEKENKNNINSFSLKEEINKEEKIRAAFLEFYDAYPGFKLGKEDEYENFRRKHADYQEEAGKLMPALTEYKRWRVMMQNLNLFTPPVPHMKTWTNQRRWNARLENPYTDEDSSYEIVT